MIKGTYKIGNLEFLHNHKGRRIEVTAWREDSWLGEMAALCDNDLTAYVHAAHDLYKLLKKEGKLNGKK